MPDNTVTFQLLNMKSSACDRHRSLQFHLNLSYVYNTKSCIDGFDCFVFTFLCSVIIDYLGLRYNKEASRTEFN